jgi:hypothetical protein
MKQRTSLIAISQQPFGDFAFDHANVRTILNAARRIVAEGLRKGKGTLIVRERRFSLAFRA